LRKNGCIVISDGDKDHQRTRRQANFGKLVRDKIPEKIASQQEQQSVATIPLSARTGFLVGKFIEEILEAREADNSADRRAEFADVFEVFRALIAAADENFTDVVAEADRKKKNVGGFEDGKLLLATSLPKAGEELTSKDSVISSQLVGTLTSDQVYRLPFTYFGFSEIGQHRLLRFPNAEYDIQITLQRDCIELSLKRTPEQLKLDI
jgi:predicted house-cleaning noncanonical NTP pyrophosphatase (MazG superfamily)